MTVHAGIAYQLRRLEENKAVKRRDRMERQQTVHVNDMDGSAGNFYSVQGVSANMDSSHSSLQSRHGDSDELIIASAAPKATVYVEPPQSDKFDFVNVRPRSSYQPPGRLPALGDAKPKTRECSVCVRASDCRC